MNRQRLSSLAIESRNRIDANWRSLLRIARGADHIRTDGAFPGYFDTDQDQATWQNDVAALGGQWVAGLEGRREKVSSDTAFTKTTRRFLLRLRRLQRALRRCTSSRPRRATTTTRSSAATPPASWPTASSFTPQWRASASLGTRLQGAELQRPVLPAVLRLLGQPRPEAGAGAQRRTGVAPRRRRAAGRAGAVPEPRARPDRRRSELHDGGQREQGAHPRRDARRGVARGHLDRARRVHAPGRRGCRDRHPAACAAPACSAAPASAWCWASGAPASSWVGSGERFGAASNSDASRMGGYGLVNLNAAWSVTPSWTLAARLNNAADKRYELVQGYNTPASQPVRVAGVLRPVDERRDGCPWPARCELWLLLALAARRDAVAGAGQRQQRDAAGRGAAPAVSSPTPAAPREVLHTLRLPRALAAFARRRAARAGRRADAGAAAQPAGRPLRAGRLRRRLGRRAAGAAARRRRAWWSQLGAFAGALLSIVLVFALAQRDLSRVDTAARLDSAPRLLLTGVMLAALWSALITLLLMLAPEARLRGMLFWLAGDLGGSDAGAGAADRAGAAAAARLAAGARAQRAAARRGRRAGAGRAGAARCAASSTCWPRWPRAVAVTTGGAIGFVGLVVPHALRLRDRQRPARAAAGLRAGRRHACCCWPTRWRARCVAPQQLPVGVITALLGAPTFIALLLRRGRTMSADQAAARDARPDGGGRRRAR